MAKKPQFTITLQLGDKTYKSKGADALEALLNLERPVKIMSKGILTVSDGIKSKTQLYFPVRLQRLFYNKYFAQIQAKQLALLMK